MPSTTLHFPSLFNPFVIMRCDSIIAARRLCPCLALCRPGVDRRSSSNVCSGSEAHSSFGACQARLTAQRHMLVWQALREDKHDR